LRFCIIRRQTYELSEILYAGHRDIFIGDQSVFLLLYSNCRGELGSQVFGNLSLLCRGFLRRDKLLHVHVAYLRDACLRRLARSARSGKNP